MSPSHQSGQCIVVDRVASVKSGPKRGATVPENTLHEKALQVVHLSNPNTFKGSDSKDYICSIPESNKSVTKFIINPNLLQITGFSNLMLEEN